MKRTLALLTALLLTQLAALHAVAKDAALPLAGDVPLPPAGLQAPGGEALPVMSGVPAKDAPSISAVSETTFPDETLVMSGAGLAGAKLRLWAEGGVRDVEPMRAAEDKMLAIVPKDLPRSTMLVWPVKGELVGVPIRVNGATAWWAWPARVSTEQVSEGERVRLLGKNLRVGEAKPQLALVGGKSAQWLRVTEATPYSIEAELPKGLAAGEYQLRAHNGTGGAAGWSEAVSFSIVAAPSQRALRTFRVDDFGAKPDDGDDDSAGIEAAMQAAAKAGGGIVEFSAGVYRVSRAIITPAGDGAGVHLIGAGKGEHDAKTHAVSGKNTLIRPLKEKADAKTTLPEIVRLRGRADSVRDVTLFNVHPSLPYKIAVSRGGPPAFVACRMLAPDQALERVRLILDVGRDWSVPMAQRDSSVPPTEMPQLFDPALFVYVAGRADIRVEDCELHSAGCGLQIGLLQPSHGSDAVCAPDVRSVRVSRCVFRGYGRGFYIVPKDAGYQAVMGLYASGINNFNGIELIVEDCDFAGADRAGGLMMNRTILHYHTSIRSTLFLRNKSRDVSQLCPPESATVNQGEQILFHIHYPFGGYFDVSGAGADWVELNQNDPRTKGELKTGWEVVTVADRTDSRVRDEVGKNENWIVFVAAGRGVGQFRVVTGRDRANGSDRLLLQHPWRVVPDATSRVVLSAAFRQNVIHECELDRGPDDPKSKAGGVLLWMNSFDNQVSGNTFKRVAWGVAINSIFRSPCGWNNVRDNVLEGITGYSNGESQTAAFFSSHYAIRATTDPLLADKDDCRGWFTVGNVFRANRGHDAPAAAYVHGAAFYAWAVEQRKKLLASPPLTNAGMMMEVMENNRFTGVQRGIVINPALNWSVIRHNTIELTKPGAPAILDQSGGNAAESFITGKE